MSIGSGFESLSALNEKADMEWGGVEEDLGALADSDDYEEEVIYVDDDGNEVHDDDYEEEVVYVDEDGNEVHDDDYEEEVIYVDDDGNEVHDDDYEDDGYEGEVINVDEDGNEVHDDDYEGEVINVDEDGNEVHDDDYEGEVVYVDDDGNEVHDDGYEGEVINVDEDGNEIQDDDYEEEVVYVDDDGNEVAEDYGEEPGLDSFSGFLGDDEYNEDLEEVVYVDEGGNEIPDEDLGGFDEPEPQGVSSDGLDHMPTAGSARLDTADSGVVTTLNIQSTSYELTRKTILLDDIVSSAPKKASRKKSYRGLTQVVKEMGVLTPIHVMVTESYSEWLESGEGAVFEGNKYLLLDGFRRVYAAYRNGLEEVEAIVWQFSNPEYGRDMANIISLVLNKSQERDWDEIWGLMQVLESEAAMSPSVLEYLLELESGDSVKLKDIAMSTNYPEVWEELLEGKKDLKQATSMLAKLRKDEDKTLIEDSTGLADHEDAEGIVLDTEGEDITDDDVKELMEIGGEDLNFSGIDEDEFLGEDLGELQSTSERKPLDPILRGKILARDEYTCQICRGGEGITSSLFVMGMEIHHTTGVYNQLEGSRDDTGTIFEGSEIPKLLTTCATDHKMIHLCAGREGKLGISKEEFETLPDHEQDRWRNIAQYAKVLLWAEKKSGKSLKKSENYKLPNVPFWEAEKENTDALREAQKEYEESN